VAAVNSLESAAWACSDGELRARTDEFRRRLAARESQGTVLPEAFGTVREAARRALGQRHHDAQVMGCAVLHLGKIAEMRTGEGKTLTATLPAYLAAPAGRGVHVMTANDYLAARDREWMRPVCEGLGLTAGLADPQPNPDRSARRAEYAADITYGSCERFGYDFLRDNLAWSPDERVERELAAVIVDEADFVQAWTPMNISAPAPRGKSLHAEMARLVSRLRPGVDFDADQTAQTASLTAAGKSTVEDWLGVESLCNERDASLIRLVDSAITVRALYERGREYQASDGQVVVIDKNTGRPYPGRRFGGGIHEALEAKEGLPVRSAMQLLATVTVRDYLQQYDHLGGMTGTAMSGLPFYRDLYRLEVVAIPDEPANDPSRSSGPGVPHHASEAGGDRGRGRRAARVRPAGAGRRDVRRAGGDDLRAPHLGRRPA
jgi:preprotein translocase subunit SecA